MAAMIAGPLCARGQDAAEAEPELDLAIWDRSVNLRGGFGYKDNVLLSNIDRQGSVFWQTTLDAMLLRADLAGLVKSLEGKGNRRITVLQRIASVVARLDSIVEGVNR